MIPRYVVKKNPPSGGCQYFLYFHNIRHQFAISIELITLCSLWANMPIFVENLLVFRNTKIMNEMTNE